MRSRATFACNAAVMDKPTPTSNPLLVVNNLLNNALQNGFQLLGSSRLCVPFLSLQCEGA